jgi:ectoine hydroxylase-related dioxygenase (phytanoyl-CoA dioxygenase family)
MAPTELNSYALTEAQTLALHEDGFVGPLTLWEPFETAAIRAVLERLYLDDPDPTIGPNIRHIRHQEIVDLLHRRQLTDAMASVMGEDLFLWRVGFFNKAAREKRGEIPWHQDRNYWPLEPVIVCSAWIAVDDVDVDNSAMHVIPGSHRQLVPHIPATEEQVFLEQADPNHFNVEQAVPIELRAGQFVLFNERLLHWSPANVSDRRRFGLAARVLPPQVRVLTYDSEAHSLVQLRGGDPLGFNRIVEPGA